MTLRLSSGLGAVQLVFESDEQSSGLGDEGSLYALQKPCGHRSRHVSQVEQIKPSSTCRTLVSPGKDPKKGVLPSSPDTTRLSAVSKSGHGSLVARRLDNESLIWQEIN